VAVRLDLQTAAQLSQPFSHTSNPNSWSSRRSDFIQLVICYAVSFTVREFKKQFVLTVLRDLDCNETKAARVLRMHRNTLARTLSELDLDIRALRKTKRRPVRGVDPPRQKKLAS